MLILFFAETERLWFDLTDIFIMFSHVLVTHYPNDKNLDWYKLKAFADDKISVNEHLKFVLERIENIVGNGENAGYQHFLFFPLCFQNSSVSGSLKLGFV